MYCVYVLQSIVDNKRYIGCTSNFRKRFSQHQNSKSKSTALRKPFKIIYLEFCVNKYDSFYREKYFKTGFGRRYLNNRLKNYYSNERPRPPRETSSRGDAGEGGL